MAKEKSKLSITPANLTQQPSATVEELRKDLDLWFRVQVLIFDLGNIAKEIGAKGKGAKMGSSEERISTTTHHLYISQPYFSDEQASRILETKVDSPPTTDISTPDEASDEPTSSEISGLTIEQAIYARMNDFLDKRKASGDYRPCGPHDLQPLYLEVFGITKADLESENLVSRVRYVRNAEFIPSQLNEGETSAKGANSSKKDSARAKAKGKSKS